MSQIASNAPTLAVKRRIRPTQPVQRARKDTPFRFLSLPAELQQHALSFLKIRDLKTAGLASKKMRESTVPWLFHTTTEVWPEANYRNFPFYALPYVRKIRFEFELAKRGVNVAMLARELLDSQIALLPHLRGLVDARIDCSCRNLLDLHNLDRPIDILANSIAAVSKLCSSAKLHIHVCNAAGNDFDIWNAVEVNLLNGLSGIRIDELRLEDRYRQEYNGDVVHSDESATYHHIKDLVSAGLSKLTMEGPYFLSTSLSKSSLLGLRSLNLTIGFVDDTTLQTFLLTSLPAVIESCGASLSEVTLDFPWDPESDELTTIPKIAWPKLSDLRLEEGAFRLIASALPGIHCNSLTINLPHPSSFESLHDLLLLEPFPFPFTRCIHLKMVEYDDDWEDFVPWLSVVERECSDHAIQLSLDLQYKNLAGDGLNDVQRCLEHFRKTLTNLHIPPPSIHAQDEESLDISLPKLATASFDFCDIIVQGGGQYNPTSSGLAFKLIISGTSAPALRHLKLQVSSQRLDYLEALIRLFTDGRFPQLESISGQLRTGTPKEGWKGTIRSALKKALLQACRSKRIDTSELEWL